MRLPTLHTEEVFDPETHEGTWWLPDAPQRTFRGRLVFDAGLLELAIDDSLFEPTVEPGIYSFEGSFGVWLEVPAVHGLVDDQPVTLLQLGGLSMAMPGAFKVNEEWHAQFAIFGEHLDPDSTFDRIDLTLEHLDEFIGVGPVIPNLSGRDEEIEAVDAVAKRLSVTTGEVIGAGRVEFFVRARFSVANNATTIGNVGQVRFVATEPIALGELFVHAGRLRELVRLSTHCECAITSAYVGPAGRSVGLRVLRPLTSVGRRPCTRGASHNMFFTVRTIPGGSGAFDVWWSLRDRYRRAWSLLTVHDDGRFPNAGERFAAYVRAVEALHYVDFSTPRIAVAEKDERVAEALDALPPHLREWAEPLLTKAYADFFRARLRELIIYLGVVGTRLVGGDIEAFIDAATKTRNEVIHPPPEQRKGLDEIGQIWMGTALYWIAHCYLVVRLGMSPDDLNRRLDRMPGAREVEERMRTNLEPLTARNDQ